MEVSGARATAANTADIPTRANAPRWRSEKPHTGSMRATNPEPTAAPMNRLGAKAPPEAPDEMVAEVATILSPTTAASTHQVTVPDRRRKATKSWPVPSTSGSRGSDPSRSQVDTSPVTATTAPRAMGIAHGTARHRSPRRSLQPRARRNR